MIYYKKIRYKIGILWLKYINRCILPKPAGLFYPKHVVLTVLQEILASILPCSTYSPTKLFPPGFGPKALSGRLKAFSTKLKRKTDNMISLFALLSLSVVQNVCRLLKCVLSPSSITRGYCHGDHIVKNSWQFMAKKNILLDLSLFLLHGEWGPKLLKSKSTQILSLASLGLCYYRLNKIHELLLATVAPIQKQGPLGYAVIVRPGWETISVRPFRRGQSGSTFREPGQLPAFLLSCYPIARLTGTKMDLGSGC